MKKLFALFAILTFASCTKEEFDQDLTRNLSIQSVSNGATYNIKIGLPENYSSSQKYATVYILDGDENFDFVAGKSKDISNKYSAQNVVVVSIGYGYNRTTDYTPTKTSDGEGGATAFLNFIGDELIPVIEREFSVDTTRKSRTILGHSFGGLLGAYAFTNFNQVFGNYILLSPSLWYDNEVMFRFEREHRPGIINEEHLVFMGLGQLENGGRMQAPFEAFYQQLRNNYTYMKLGKHIVPLLDHTGSKNENIEEGLKFYFLNR